MPTLASVTPNLNTDIASTLRWAGVENIGAPISIFSQKGMLQSFVANANVYAGLDIRKAKSIHVPRSHSIINQMSSIDCKQEAIEQFLDEAIQSQNKLGRNTKIEPEFNLLLMKTTLSDDEIAYPSYPVVLDAERNEAGLTCGLKLTILYSSTCSASPAHQLQANTLERVFSDSKVDKTDLVIWLQSPPISPPIIDATEHGQRSYAYIKLSLGSDNKPDLPSLINQLGEIAGIPEQKAIKRKDEQEFASLNADNLMFCKDAANQLNLDSKV